MRIAIVKTAGSDKEVLIPITSLDKPEIPIDILNKWQKIVDLAAKIIGVPSGLVTRLSEDKLEVFLTSNTESNIFDTSMKLDLGLGWYCETVAGKRDVMILTDSRKSEDWKENNPSEPFNLISYLGMPIMWPDGEVFGTFCMLDSKEHQYSDLFIELISSLREIIQNDLNSVILFQKTQNELLKKELLLKEIHHRIKNQFNLLVSTLNLQSNIDSDQKDIKSILKDIQGRILVISQIHDKLYHSTNLKDLFLVDYLSSLGKYIIETISQKKIKFQCSGSQVNLSTSISLSCGIIVNELITNSVKYAFSNCEFPEITIHLEDKNEYELVLSYRDNGLGLPQDFNFNESNSLGMILIKHSVSQLGGTYKIANQNGFYFEMLFNTE